MFELSGMIAVETQEVDKPNSDSDEESVEMSSVSRSSYHPMKGSQSQSRRYQNI